MDRRQEVEEKLAAVRRWLTAQGLDGVLIGSQGNFAWMTAGGDNHVALGEAGGVGSVLVTHNGAHVLSSNIERARLLDEETAGLPFEAVDWPWHEPERARAVVAGLAGAEGTASDLGALGLGRADISGLRRTLLAPEVERYRGLGRDAADAVEVACRAAVAGQRELDVAARLSSECRARNILDLVNLVAADERIARYRHPIPTENRVGRTLLVALTGRRHGLHASLTRMVALARPDDELRARHLAVRRVDAREILESRPGVSLGAVMLAGAQQYEAEGFPGEWRRHHQGGLTGYAGREVFATPTTTDGLGASQAVAWNPSITRVKSEDTVLVGDDGAHVLTRTGSWPEEQVTLAAGSVSRPLLLEEDR